MEKDIERHEVVLRDHGERIGRLEVNQAVLSDNMNTIKRLGFWAVTLLGGGFLIQLVNLVMKGAGQ